MQATDTFPYKSEVVTNKSLQNVLKHGHIQTQSLPDKTFYAVMTVKGAMVFL